MVVEMADAAKVPLLLFAYVAQDDKSGKPHRVDTVARQRSAANDAGFCCLAAPGEQGDWHRFLVRTGLSGVMAGKTVSR